MSETPTDTIEQLSAAETPDHAGNTEVDGASAGIKQHIEATLSLPTHVHTAVEALMQELAWDGRTYKFTPEQNAVITRIAVLGKEYRIPRGTMAKITKLPYQRLTQCSEVADGLDILTGTERAMLAAAIGVLREELAQQQGIRTQWNDRMRMALAVGINLTSKTGAVITSFTAQFKAGANTVADVNKDFAGSTTAALFRQLGVTIEAIEDATMEKPQPEAAKPPAEQDSALAERVAAAERRADEAHAAAASMVEGLGELAGVVESQAGSIATVMGLKGEVERIAGAMDGLIRKADDAAAAGAARRSAEETAGRMAALEGTPSLSDAVSARMRELEETFRATREQLADLLAQVAAAKERAEGDRQTIQALREEVAALRDDAATKEDLQHAQAAGAEAIEQVGALRNAAATKADVEAVSAKVGTLAEQVTALAWAEPAPSPAPLAPAPVEPAPAETALAPVAPREVAAPEIVPAAPGNGETVVARIRTTPDGKGPAKLSIKRGADGGIHLKSTGGVEVDVMDRE